jgi:hypothetical protein
MERMKSLNSKWIAEIASNVATNIATNTAKKVALETSSALVRDEVEKCVRESLEQSHEIERKEKKDKKEKNNKDNKNSKENKETPILGSGQKKTFNPFFNSDKYLTRDSFAELGSDGYVNLSVELPGSLSQVPQIYIFENTDCNKIGKISPRELVLSLSTDTFSGTAKGNLRKIYDNSAREVYVITLSSYFLSSAKEISFEEIDLPAKFIYNGSLIE